MPQWARDRLFTSYISYLTAQGRDLSMSETESRLPADHRTQTGSRTPLEALPGVPAGNTATGWLKIIALAFMLVDHMGVVIFPGIPEFRIIGRIAFPIYCWCMVVGFCYTRSVPGYLLRILLVGLLSQPLYAFVMNHLGTAESTVRTIFADGALFRDGNLFTVLGAVFSKPNIFLTLFLALSALWGIRAKKCFSQIWAPAAAMVLAVVLNADYSWKGVLFILLLYAGRSSRPAIAAVMIAFFLYWGTAYGVTQSLFGIPLKLNELPSWLSVLVTPWLRMETFGLLSMPLILIRFPRNLRMPRWVGYALYPVHLLIILLLKTIIL